MFINCLLVAVQQAGLGIELSDGGRVGGLLFADDLCRNCNLTSTTMQVIHKHVNIHKSLQETCPYVPSQHKALLVCNFFFSLSFFLFYFIVCCLHWILNKFFYMIKKE